MRYAILFVIVCLLGAFQAKAQNYYWIAFSDKNQSEYSLSNPEEYLSDRAIERREQQNILIDSMDLPVNSTYIDSVLKLDVELVHASKWLNGITVKTSIDSLEKEVEDWSFVLEVQLNKPKIVTKSAFNKFEELGESLDPIDTSYYGGSVHQVGMLNGQYLQSKNIKAQGMHIAILDAGFYKANELPAFDSLWYNNQILGTKDFVDPNSNIWNTHYHGMSVLSCMGGNIPGELIGTATKASYWLLRSEDSGSEYIIEEDNWVVAAEFADSVGVDVINSSLGYYEFDDASTNHVYAEMDGKTTRVTKGANIAASRGILVFASAGNERDDPWERIIAPSDGDLVVGVGAVDKELQPAYFTSAGPAADGDIKPNISAMGYHSVVQRSDGSIGLANGTSFSSPIMAGMATSLWQNYPNKTAAEIKNALELSGHMHNEPDSLLGYGVPNMKVAVSILGPLAIADLHIDKNWAVYPNPVKDYIVLQNKDGSVENKIDIELYSMSGQLIRKWQKPLSGKIVLRDIENTTNGMFILKICSGNNVETFKLSKAR